MTLQTTGHPHPPPQNMFLGNKSKELSLGRESLQENKPSESEKSGRGNTVLKSSVTQNALFLWDTLP